MYAFRSPGSVPLIPMTPDCGCPGPWFPKFDTNGTVWSNPTAHGNFAGCVTPAVWFVVTTYGAFSPMFAGMLLKISSYPTRKPVRITVSSVPNSECSTCGVYASPTTGPKLFLSDATPLLLSVDGA